MGVKSPSQRKLSLGTKGVCTQQLWKPGGPWSEGKMRDPHQVAFALHLGFISRLPKVGSIGPLARAALRQRWGLCCLACIGVYYPFLHHLFFGTWLTSGKPRGEVLRSWSMVNTWERAHSPSLRWRGSRNLPVPSFTTINKHRNHSQQSWLGCDQVRNVSLTSPSQTLSQRKPP